LFPYEYKSIIEEGNSEKGFYGSAKIMTRNFHILLRTKKINFAQ